MRPAGTFVDSEKVLLMCGHFCYNSGSFWPRWHPQQSQKKEAIILWTKPQSLSAGLATIVLFFLVFLTGCSNQPIAIVNGSRITRKEFYDRLEQAAGQRVLADLIARRMLADAFNKSGLTLTEQEINAEMEKIKKQAPSEAEWLRYLQSQGMTEQDFRDFVAFNLKVKKLAEKDVKVTEEALRKHFEKYRELFNQPETVRLAEIVVNDKARAEQIYAQLQNPKANFENLARQYSISTFTRERGGLRGEEVLANLQPEALRKAVQGLKEGQITRPIAADNVYYILKLVSRKPAQKAVYEKVKDKVREHYMFTHAKDVNEMIEELRKQAIVRILDPKYQEMNRLFGPPQALPTFGPTESKTSPAPGGAKAAPSGEKSAPAPQSTGGGDKGAPAGK